MVNQLLAVVEVRKLQDKVDVRATFCLERCGEGPNVRVGDRVITGATVETVIAAIDQALASP